MKFSMPTMLTLWLRDTKAATAIEYGLIAAAISFAVITAIFLMGGSLSEIFDFMVTKMATVLTKAT